MSQPIVLFDGDAYTVSLFRPDATGVMKEEKMTFGEHSLEVCAAPPNELHMWDRAKINGPPAEDGLIYYLCARHFDVARPFFFWLKDKEESLALRKAIKDAEDLHYNAEDYWRKDSKCTFCGAMESECGGDHGDEMRDIQREYWRSERY
jgi:hypothetical protein